jgi:hypothetical protein
MNTSFSSLALNSTYLWLDNYLLQNSQAYVNTSSQFYYTADSQLPGYVTYAAPFKSLVWDSGVSGAIILNSVSGSFGSLSRGQSGMAVDFINGRVILPSSFGTSAIVSGSYSFKDFNLYFANQTQERIIFTNKYYLNSRFARPITGTPPPYSMVTPCIFVSLADNTNDSFAFGGTYNTKLNMSLIVMAESLSQLENSLSYLVDSKDSTFPLLTMDLWPLNFYGDYKSGYNYENIVSRYGATNNLFTITDVRGSKLSDSVKIDESIFIGLVDMEIAKVRSIR